MNTVTMLLSLLKLGVLTPGPSPYTALGLHHGKLGIELGYGIERRTVVDYVAETLSSTSSPPTAKPDPDKDKEDKDHDDKDKKEHKDKDGKGKEKEDSVQSGIVVTSHDIYKPVYLLGVSYELFKHVDIAAGAKFKDIHDAGNGKTSGYLGLTVKF